MTSMDDTEDLCNIEEDGDERNSSGESSSTSGKSANVVLWKRWQVSCGTIVVATVAWLLVECQLCCFQKRVDSFILCNSSDSNFLIILLQKSLIVVFSLHRKLQKLPKLILSEEMVNNAAASFRIKVNHALLMAHDITFGKDFKLFFKVVVCLWLLSGIAYTVSFFTLAYVGIILSVTVPVLYNKYQEHVDLFTGLIRQSVWKHYNLVDESVIGRIRRSVAM
ncbi:hypothetical protein Vadar_021768 [Vaccinium darrowii]|uniref:Uncharacterized protein n=1 Tax=Vaccinium darrowii TaxID=229202 RepID=A0ACB7YPM9_9ERIC|nr:hypothetical protein Vadar_021768 [Vaccinium darrowii]